MLSSLISPTTMALPKFFKALSVILIKSLTVMALGDMSWEIEDFDNENSDDDNSTESFWNLENLETLERKFELFCTKDIKHTSTIRTFYHEKNLNFFIYKSMF